MAAPLREAIKVAKDGPTRPPRWIPSGSGASYFYCIPPLSWCNFFWTNSFRQGRGLNGGSMERRYEARLEEMLEDAEVPPECSRA